MNQLQKIPAIQPAVALLKEFNKEWESIKSKYQSSSNLVEGFCKGFLLYYLPITLFKRKFTFTTFRRSLATGAFGGITRTLFAYFMLLKKIREKNKQYDSTTFRSQLLSLILKYPRAISGGIGCAISLMMVDDSVGVNSVFMFWCIVRAIRCSFPFNIPQAPTLIMCLSASQILSTWIFGERGELNPTYKKFLDYQGGIPRPRIDGVVALQRKSPLPSGCDFLHPGENCASFTLNFFPTAVLRAVKLYSVLYTVLLIFTKNRSLTGYIMNIVRSTLFLSLYCTLAWLSHCVFFTKISPGISRQKMYIHCLIAGVPTLFERPVRQPELAAYCATYALDSIYNHLCLNNFIRKNSLVNKSLIMLSAAVMLHHHKQQASFLTNWLLGMKYDKKEN